MRFPACLAAFAAGLLATAHAQQYKGDIINNSLPGVPGSEVTYFRVQDATGKNNNLTLINYYSHGKTNQRLVERTVQRAVIIIHGLNRDPGSYMSNMLSALSQSKDPNINFDTVAIMAPYFPNGDDKNYGYPWTDGLRPNRGSTTNALVWPGSQWAAGGNNQYPYTSTNTSSFDILDQLVRYFDDTALFPQMKQIVIAGHSLGGQTTQRYAAIGAQLGIRSPVSYWVANPNSYAWLSTSRPLSTASCPTYDNYREGYSNFASYPMTYGTALVAQGRSAILANFQSKAINYVRGTQDLGDDSSTCAPFTAGANRNERFFNYIKAFPVSCPDPSGRNCDTVDFVNAGHDASAIMASDAGQARLFSDNFYGNGNRSFDFGYPRQQAGDDPYPNPALNTSSTLVNNQTYAGNMTYWGCWSDQVPQTLTNLSYEGNANTIEHCSRLCTDGNNTIAGLEYGTQCFCGNTLGYKATQVIDSSCSMPCPGNTSEMCGSNNRLSLFSNGTPMLQPTPGNPETVGEFYYADCYTEATSGRALTGAGTTSNSMSLNFCASFCSGYQYFGAEYGSECYCGNILGAGANRTAAGDCGMTCADAPAEFCGAGNRLTVYQDPNWTAGSSSVSSGSSSSLSWSSSTSTVSSTTTGSSASASSAAISCPTSNNTVVVSSGKNFLIECGVDHYAGDLTSLGVSSFQACVDACALNTQCVDVSLSGAACYLKSTLGAAVSNNGIWGAKLISASPVSSLSSTTSFTSSSSIGSSSFASSASASSGITSSTTRSLSLTLPSSTPSSAISTAAFSSRPSTGASSNSEAGSTASTTASDFSSSVSLSASSAKPSSVSDSPTTTSGGSSSASSESSQSTTRATTFKSTTAASPTSGSLLSSLTVSSLSSTRSDNSLTSSSTFTTSSGSASSTSISCPGSNSTTYMTNGMPFLIECGVDHAGGDMGVVSVSGFQQCIDSCAKTSGCVAVALSGVACYTKSRVGTPVTNGVLGARLIALSSSSIMTTSTTLMSTTPISISSSSATMTTLSTGLSSASLVSSSSLSTLITSTVTSSVGSTSTTPSVSQPISSSASSSTTTSLPSGFSSLGCYYDSSTRLLPYSNGSSSTQTPRQCALSCQALNYKYSGTEYAQECWCGNTATESFNAAPATSCNMACKGDSTQTCGAGNRLSVVENLNWQPSITVPRTYYAKDPYAADWIFQDCYEDSTAARALATPVPLGLFGGSGNATVENCLNACQGRSYTWCGLEYYSECWGGSSRPTTAMGTSPDPLAAGCNYPCNGNRSEACGGANKLQVYMNAAFN